MTRLATALLVAVAFLAPAALAATPLEETRALERRISEDPRKAIVEGRESLAQAEKAGDKAAQLKALRLLAMAYDNLDDNPGLREAANKGLALARELGDKPAQAELTTFVGMSVYNEGHIDDALKRHEQAIAFAQNNHLERELGKAYAAKAYALMAQERTSEAMDVLMKAHAVFEKLGEKGLLSGTLVTVGNILSNENASREDLLRAIDYQRRAMALLEPSAKYEQSTIYFNMGVAYEHLKDYPEALKSLAKCLAIAREIKDPHTIAFVNYRLGSIEAARANHEAALEYFDAALPGFRNAENVQLELNTQLRRAKAFAALGRRPQALSTLAAAKSLVERLNTPGHDVRYHEAAAEMYARLGEWLQAFEQMRALREAERRMAQAANQKQAMELQARFSEKQRETENELLRTEGKLQEGRRLVLVMALALVCLVALALVGYVWRQARQKSRFAALAMRDDLTGLPNRRSILEFAKAQFRGRRVGDAGFVLALIDLDHFKAVNDELGHSVGDEVLRAFAQAGLRVMRSEDRLGRFGGEEFVLVMPKAGIEQVPAVFARLRQAVSEIRALGYPADRPITFSMGATAMRPADPDLDSIIKRADQALYEAKNHGRDRHEVA